MYIFYENFQYVHTRAKALSITWLVNQVVCHENCSGRLMEKLSRKHGRDFSYNKRTGKGYVRKRVRRSTVSYRRGTWGEPFEFDYSFSENYILGMVKQKGIDREDYA